jgi:hypothetical protein
MANHSVLCSHCAHHCHGKGVSRVRGVILFHFCRVCWITKRQACVDMMLAVGGPPKRIKAKAAGAR